MNITNKTESKNVSHPSQVRDTEPATSAPHQTQWVIVDAPASVCSYRPEVGLDSFERPADGRALRRTKAIIMIPVTPSAPNEGTQALNSSGQKK